MGDAYLNHIATSVPEHDVHRKFVNYAPRLLEDPASSPLFQRMASRAQIDHRYSFLEPHASDDHLDTMDFYRTDHFPGVESRMQFFQDHAFSLASPALDRIDLDGVTHILMTTCTGFYAPGLDLEIVRHYGLKTSVERTIIGFMGCYAALNALKLARHIVRSDNDARVLILNIELCTLHLQPGGTLESVLSFLIFGDGCAASVVSSKPTGLELKSFHTAILPASAEQITWIIGNLGFEINLSGRVPATIATALPEHLRSMLDGCPKDIITHWAIHPGGRSVLDAVRDGAQLTENNLAVSRDILRQYGNMPSATIMFVLASIMKGGKSGSGCAMAFGPGLTVESMRFSVGGSP